MSEYYNFRGFTADGKRKHEKTRTRKKTQGLTLRRWPDVQRALFKLRLHSESAAGHLAVALQELQPRAGVTRLAPVPLPGGGASSQKSPDDFSVSDVKKV